MSASGSSPLAPAPQARPSNKTVSFHPESTFHERHTATSQRFSHLSEPGWESRESNSGYAAQDGGSTADEGIRRSYYKRLYKFYEKYNPQKLCNVEKLLSECRGEEEQLFAILVGKYGPEPEDESAMKSMNSVFSSEGDSVMHYSGKRCQFPKKVRPEEGNTDCDTPYWAGGSTLIGDRDLLTLLQNLETPNVELQKCFMGLFAQHPTDCWNGMAYITRAEGIAPADTPFLGHTWVGTLGSGKVLIHEGKKYHRTTLYCTEECQKRGNHERWRLSVYRGELNYLILLRTVWDPVVVPEPVPLNRSNLSEREFHSSSDALPTRLSSASSIDSSSSSTRQPLQPQEPQQPSATATPVQLSKLMEDLELRIMRRLDGIEERLERLENAR
ncbi:hypothetical protein ABB37_01084 [Leptomonas pyrrhocoris]|uniref:Uncharacterized protein n=1 Tax=Leptomonas pyrrhocoris TaxID=157538 RepID=A0A0N0DYU1_LEPPY|nr:hypothetical protein ABB37_01084 [Leptomonas pyrrhocoris]KPA84548.1 hypothetical protein ABB37_01084 [Leptomonas pyrrhocoris]|eukprot:XP_015662987.1 hypothetical protein ABB37_01084 [Leptomonas pyrrhocoris]